MVDPGFGSAVISWPVTKLLDELLRALKDTVKLPKYCGQLNVYVLRIKALVSAAQASSSTSAALPQGNGDIEVKEWLQDVEVVLEEAILLVAKCGALPAGKVNSVKHCNKRLKLSRRILSVTRRLKEVGSTEATWACLAKETAIQDSVAAQGYLVEKILNGTEDNQILLKEVGELLDKRKAGNGMVEAVEQLVEEFHKIEEQVFEINQDLVQEIEELRTEVKQTGEVVSYISCRTNQILDLSTQTRDMILQDHVLSTQTRDMMHQELILVTQTRDMMRDVLDEVSQMKSQIEELRPTSGVPRSLPTSSTWTRDMMHQELVLCTQTRVMMHEELVLCTQTRVMMQDMMRDVLDGVSQMKSQIEELRPTSGVSKSLSSSSTCPSMSYSGNWGLVSMANRFIKLLPWRWRGYSKKQHAHLIAILLKGVTLMPLRDLQRATNNFSKSSQIGVGGFATVYLGEFVDGTKVAIKMLSKNYRDSPGIRNLLLNEGGILSRVNHRHLVRLLGCCMQSNNPALVLEFVPNGTLAEHLFNRGTRRREVQGALMSWKQRLLIAVQISDALAYLHSTADPPIIHRDVKPGNILLDENLNAKLVDFGISKLAPKGATLVHVDLCGMKGISLGPIGESTCVMGTLGYVDPEYHQTLQVTAKSDVYGFGILLHIVVRDAIGYLPLEILQVEISDEFSLFSSLKNQYF